MLSLAASRPVQREFSSSRPERSETTAPASARSGWSSLFRLSCPRVSSCLVTCPGCGTLFLPRSYRLAFPVHESRRDTWSSTWKSNLRSEEHTSELQSHLNIVCRLLL